MLATRRSVSAPISKVQIVLLRTSIAVSRGDGDLAKDSLDNWDPLYSIAFTDGNGSIRLLDRQ